MLDLDQITAADFTPRLHEKFELLTDKGGITLQLEQVEEFPAPAHMKRKPFVLRFRGQSGLRLPQATYRLENKALGLLEIFLVQVEGRADGSQLEAIFS